MQDFEKPFHCLLRRNRHDAQRAKAYDTWVVSQPSPIQEACAYKLGLLKSDWGLDDNQAKAVLVMLMLLMYMKPDELLRWIEHGNHVRAEFEWAYPGLKMQEFLRQEEPV